MFSEFSSNDFSSLLSSQLPFSQDSTVRTIFTDTMTSDSEVSEGVDARCCGEFPSLSLFSLAWG